MTGVECRAFRCSGRVFFAQPVLSLPLLCFKVKGREETKSMRAGGSARVCVEEEYLSRRRGIISLARAKARREKVF